MGTNPTFLRTRFEWIDLLAAYSPVVARLQLKTQLGDDVYSVSGQPATNADAFNFSNSKEHSKAIAHVLEELAKSGVDDTLISKFVTDLTTRNMWGTFCELSAYDFLQSGGHNFEIQIPVTGADILNPNGSDLDGLLHLGEEKVFFDAKAFGFTEHLVKLLVDRLMIDLSPLFVKAQGSLDVSVNMLNELLSINYGALKSELTKSHQATRGTIVFTTHQPSTVQVSSRTVVASSLANENKDYVFRFAKRFARHSPFFLFFTIHPWVGSIRLHNNFANEVDNFTSEFARLTFTAHASDTSPVFDITRAAAADLLTGIVFINAWQGEPAREQPFYRCFINSRATNTITTQAVDDFSRPYGSNMRVIRI